MSKLSWKPELHGEIYCSPACGGNCTKAAHDAAKKGANELVSRLGPGWRPRVWENLGWFYEAISPCGRIAVSKTLGTPVRYHAFLGKAHSHAGLWVEEASTPNQAIAKVIETGKRHVAELQAMIEGL